MAEISNKKLIVEVCNAKTLMSKDGQGTASANAIVDFDGQRRRTKTMFRDLNPRWDEELESLVHDDAESPAAETLELNLYNDKKTTNKQRTFLSKVKINGTSFSTSEPTNLVWLKEDQITPLPEEQKLSPIGIGSDSGGEFGASNESTDIYFTRIPKGSFYWSYHFIAHASNASYQHWQQMGGVNIVENMLTDGWSKHQRSNSCGTARGHGML
ncbi:hypothetical protein RHSIM_Rhsim08G0154400 [Rhododendron simsii]|uniref:C2 domain-containing protein n=1 Tax=Rhododendron simsii TaxID=118357 RepID=A0A834GGB8_RHOSS|nr:hypothetical protein RHSIM_Rhsim08G0154400 [Rhododendron simsii]